MRDAGKGNFIFAVGSELGSADFPYSHLTRFKVDSIQIYSVFLKEVIKLASPSVSIDLPDLQCWISWGHQGSGDPAFRELTGDIKEVEVLPSENLLGDTQALKVLTVGMSAGGTPHSWGHQGFLRGGLVGRTSMSILTIIYWRIQKHGHSAKCFMLTSSWIFTISLSGGEYY